MKKSQLVSIFTTLALVFCMALMPALTACGTIPSDYDTQTQATDNGTDEQGDDASDDGTAGSVTLQLDNDDDSDGSDEGASAAGDPTSSQGESEGTDEAATSTDNEGDATQTSSGSSNASKVTVTEDGWYTSKEEVALYIHTYGRLPGNFISKTKARKAGWVAKEGNLDEVCPGMSIGGSVYYNEGWDGEEPLPEAKGRTWTECDINYHGGYRGAERLVFSNDGLIFYTDDHYQTFEQLY